MSVTGTVPTKVPTKLSELELDAGGMKIDNLGIGDTPDDAMRRDEKTGDYEVFGLLAVGLAANRPAPGIVDRFYFSTDTLVLERDTGIAWVEVVRGETATRLVQLAEKTHGSLTGIAASDHHVKTTLFTVLTDRWTLAQAHRGALDKIMVFKGPAADPVEEDKPAPGGDVFLTIAAANTPATLKDRADYICDGTATTGGDQVEINDALAAADVVILGPGTYWIDASIVMATGKSLIGGGSGCVIKLKNAIDANVNMVENSDTTGGNDHITIKNLMLDGNKANQAAGWQYAIYFKKVGSGTGASALLGCKIEGCSVENLRTNGIELDTVYNSSFANNTIRGISGHGIHLIKCRYNTIIGNTVQGCIGDGIYLYQSWFNTVTGNVCEGNSYGITVYMSHGNTVSGNNCCNNSANGIYLYTAQDNTVSGNNCRGNTSNGIYLTLSTRNTVSGNKCAENGRGITLDNNSHYNTISGNNCHRNSYQGITLTASNFNNIAANTVYANSREGIYLFSCYNNNIVGNSCLENSNYNHNTYDNISLAYYCDYNLIVGNICRQGETANRPRYGINIGSDTCDRNCLIGNDLYDSGATGDLNDVPTTNPTLKHDNRNLAGTGWLAEV